jgi:cytochrome bd-type quinol oxidase subunit 2
VELHPLWLSRLQFAPAVGFHFLAGHDLTIYSASSTPGTLTVMLIIAAVGMAPVIGYTALVYTVFMGKVILDSDSY